MGLVLPRLKCGRLKQDGPDALHLAHPLARRKIIDYPFRTRASLVARIPDPFRLVRVAIRSRGCFHP